MKDLPALEVVAALLVRGDRVLAGRRASHKSSPGFWEFPGGKVEAGEDPFVALEREIKEELGLYCRANETFDLSETKGDPFVIRLHAIVCEFDYEGEISSTDHDELRWLGVGELEEVKWAKPDLPAVRRLMGMESFSGLLN